MALQAVSNIKMSIRLPMSNYLRMQTHVSWTQAQDLIAECNNSLCFNQGGSRKKRIFKKKSRWRTTKMQLRISTAAPDKYRSSWNSAELCRNAHGPKVLLKPTSWQSSNLRGFLVPPQAQSLELPSAPSLFYVTSLLDTRPSGTRWQQLTSSLVFAELPPWPGWAGGERHRSTE